MRDIKFRAWDKKYRQMASFEKMQAAKVFALDSGLDAAQFIVLPQHENVVLQQFTGLKDKNGKEIYEGDVLRCGELPGVCEMRMEDGAWSPYVALDGGTEWEVIGNIYQNPELLNPHS